MDKDKNPVDMLEQGEKLYVKVTYEVKDDTIKNPVLGIALSPTSKSIEPIEGLTFCLRFFCYFT
ncbi:hypothetical protein EfmAA610_09750 [Enterococcus faecium]|nr:hypothetical protein EfmAA610_09750 [Enterococcus faecium]